MCPQLQDREEQEGPAKPVDTAMICGRESHSSKGSGAAPPAWCLKHVGSGLSLLLPNRLCGKFGGPDVTANDPCVCPSQMILPCADRGSPELLPASPLSGFGPTTSRQRRQREWRRLAPAVAQTHQSQAKSRRWHRAVALRRKI